MTTESVVQRFAAKHPICVMTRGVMSELLTSELDDVFEASRSRQYEQDLLFSTLASAIAEVVLNLAPSPNQAYQQFRHELGVSRTAFYNKLNRIETQTSESVVAHSAQRSTELLNRLGAPAPRPLPGYRCRVVDGNHLQASERRLKEHRTSWAAPLPGTVVATMDLQTRLIDTVYLIEDGHALERTVLDRVAKDVEPHDLLLADRHYCTIGFLTKIADASGAFVIRQHGTLKGELVGRRRKVGRSATGMVYEQSLVIGRTKSAPGLTVRRITVELDAPTRDGDTEIHLLSNVPAEDADGRVLSDLYRERWEVEKVFHVITMTLTCEAKGLNHPLAALFVFCMATVAYNARAVLLAAISSVHGEEETEQISNYSMSLEMSRAMAGLLTAVDRKEWDAWWPDTPKGKASRLKVLAAKVDLKRHRKSKRGPKRRPPGKTKYQNGSHVSTAKVLQARAKRC